MEGEASKLRSMLEDQKTNTEELVELAQQNGEVGDQMGLHVPKSCISATPIITFPPDGSLAPSARGGGAEERTQQ